VITSEYFSVGSLHRPCASSMCTKEWSRQAIWRFLTGQITAAEECLQLQGKVNSCSVSGGVAAFELGSRLLTIYHHSFGVLEVCTEKFKSQYKTGYSTTCKTEFNTQCETEYEELCRTTDKQKCHTEHYQQCHQEYSEKCKELDEWPEGVTEEGEDMAPDDSGSRKGHSL